MKTVYQQIINGNAEGVGNIDQSGNAGYVKLAKLWERSKDAAVAYHSSYYAEKFRDDADKRLVGVYIDITGNKEIYKRPEMVHLLKDCKNGSANLIFSQTSSQYSLDIQALLADWESGNKSRRMILSYDQRIMTGQYPVADLMGYRHTKDGQLVIEPEEAKTVRFIFLAFIQGYNYDQIAMILTQKKRSTLRGRQEWNGMMVANIMKNERRWGDLEARKTGG